MHLRVGIVQMASSGDKAKNIEKALKMAKSAAEKGAKLIMLPEMFNYLPKKITIEGYRQNAECLDGPTIGQLLEFSANNNVAIIAGSIAELCLEKIYNTCCLITPDGIIGTYRKIHLFKFGEIDESKVFNEGIEGKVVSWEGLKIGLTTCFDLRFPELYRVEAMQGAQIISNVAAFLEKTGRAHWIVLLRARAIENQVFIVAANQAKSQGGEPVYYGNSAVIDPWGRIIARADQSECLLIAEMDLDKATEIRNRLSLYGWMRPSSYHA